MHYLYFVEILECFSLRIAVSVMTYWKGVHGYTRGVVSYVCKPP